MGTETRIGIATGLLIVVVASVYFFYGSDRGSEELLVAGGEGAQPPRIPNSGSERSASPLKTHQASAPGAKPAGRKTVARHGPRHPPNNVHPSKGKRPRPSINVDGGLAWANRRATKPAAPSPGFNARPARSARPAPNRTIPKTRSSRRPTKPLGAGASRALVNATQRNLRRPPFAAGSDKQATAVLVEQRLPDRSAETWPKHHRIGAGDTLSDISNRYYATTTLFGRILKANPGIKSPNTLKIGDILLIPAPTPDGKPQSAAKQRMSTAAKTSGARSTTGRSNKPGGKATGTPRTYRVKNGDTFYRIAAKVLGSPSRWKELYQRNRSVVGNDPMRLKPGMVLTLPD